MCADKATIEHELTIRLTPGGRLPRTIYCINCFGDARRVPFRLGVYRCRTCEAVTEMDRDELRKLGLR